jgi:hypothetical protein
VPIHERERVTLCMVASGRKICTAWTYFAGVMGLLCLALAVMVCSGIPGGGYGVRG